MQPHSKAKLTINQRIKIKRLPKITSQQYPIYKMGAVDSIIEA